MFSRKLREVLRRESSGIDEIAREVVAASRGATLKELQDGFRVALGTAYLDYDRAQALLAAVKSLSGVAGAESADSEIAALRQEVESLDRQRRQLPPEQKQINALDAKEKEWQSARAKLKERLVELQVEDGRLETIRREIKR